MLILLFTGGQGQTPLLERNKGTLVYSQAEKQGPPGKLLSMIIIIKASQRNSFQQGVRTGFLPATHPGVILNSEITDRKQKDGKKKKKGNAALNRLGRRYLFTLRGLKQDSKLSACNLSTTHHWLTQNFHSLSMSGEITPESTVNIDLGG